MTDAARKPSKNVKDQAGRTLGPRAIETRQRLLDATSRLLDERSVLEISVAEIARQVGSVPSLFYHYFKDVDEAARAIARDAAGEMPAIVALISEGLDGADGLPRSRELVEAYIAHWERFRGALLFRNHASDCGDLAFHRIRRDALGPLIDELQRQIAESQRHGRVSREIHPQVAASGLVAMLENLAAHARRVQRLDASKGELVETCARMLHTTVTGEA
jgi:AcrR family transcriptional regulator